MSETTPSRLSSLIRGFRSFLVIVAVLAAFRSSLADWNDVPTQSMEPTILVGDRIAVNKLAYDLKVPFTTLHLAEWGAPARGDIVVFYAPGSGKRMVKRVVGVPGDTIAMRYGRLTINGRPADVQPSPAAAPTGLTDPRPHRFSTEALDGPAGARHAIMEQPLRAALRSFGPVRVPAGRYFVMGDNRDNSGDSRVFGFVPRDQIVGRTFGIALSFDQRRAYRPRWHRFARGVK